MHFRFNLVGISCCLVLGSSVGLCATKRPAQKPTHPPIVPTVPPVQPPPTPEQMPATPPNVTMNDGRLSIMAENSTLGDILNAVRTQTGADLDIPPAAAAERVAAKIGPGDPQDVLQQLFAGSRFDYIIVGSPTNPDAIQRIILTPRAAGAASASPATAQPYQPTPSSYQPPPDVSETPEPEPEPEPASPEPPMAPPQIQQPSSNQPKTPEQLLKELQQMQQQQQQMPPRNPPPQ